MGLVTHFGTSLGRGVETIADDASCWIKSGDPESTLGNHRSRWDHHSSSLVFLDARGRQGGRWASQTYNFGKFFECRVSWRVGKQTLHGFGK